MKRVIVQLYLLCALAAATAAGPLTGIVPSADELGAFDRVEEPELFSAGRLWEYINGAAPAYLAYGCRGVLTFVVLHSADSTEIIVDVYDMADTLNAFGIYSSERSTSAETIRMGSGGYRSANTLNFWQNDCYIKLTSYESTTESANHLSRMAAILSEKIPQRGKKPGRFNCFPDEDRIENSDQFISTDVLGQEYLTRGYCRDYLTGERKIRIFIIESAEEEQAGRYYLQYRELRRSLGAIEEIKCEFADEGFNAEDSYYGSIHFARWSRFLIALMGIQEQQRCGSIVQQITDSLSSQRK